MKPRERALKTLRFEPTDQVPFFNFGVVNPGFCERLSGIPFASDPEGCMIEAHRLLGIEMSAQVIVGFAGYQAGDSSAWRQMYEDTRRRIRCPEDVRDFIEADLKATKPSGELEARIRRDFRDWYVPETERRLEQCGDWCVWISCCVSYRWRPTPAPFPDEHWFMAVALWPDLVREWVLRGAWMDNIRMQVVAEEKLVPAVLTDCDIAYNGALMVSPQTFADVFLPAVAPTIAPLKEAGILAFFHSDGYIDQIVDWLCDAGIDGFHILEEDAGVDVEAIMRKWGGKKIMMPSMSRNIIHFGTDDELKAMLDRYVGYAAKYGGVFLSPHIDPILSDERIRLYFDHARARSRELMAAKACSRETQ
jgi:hypothetical protein